MTSRPARQGISGDHGGPAAQKPFLCHARRLLRSLGTSFLMLHNCRVILPNRRVRTRTHGGVTGKASDRLPMSIPWPVFETHLQNHNHFEGAFGEQYLLSEVPTIRSEPQRRPKRNLETCLGLWAKTETESLGLLRFERSINLIETG